MRIAYVCRDLAHNRLIGPGAEVFGTATAMARAGHEVYLVSAELAGECTRALRSAAMPTWVRVAHGRDDHSYFTERHHYADRVYDTVLALHRDRALDVLDFADAGGEALTVIRAKRLLGEFSRTVVAVTAAPWSTVSHGAAAHEPVRFEAGIDAFAERYCREHADAVIACSAAVAPETGRPDDRLLVRPPAPLPDGLPPLADFEPEAARTVWHLGDLRPGAGLDTLLRAADLVLEREPRFRFVLRGEDSTTDPVGRSYWHHLRRGLSGRLREALAFDGPLTPADLPALPGPGTQVVLPDAASASPHAALLAMALGHVVTARAGSAAADLVRPGNTGRVVAAGDATALAEALLAAVRDPGRAAELSAAAAGAARRDHDGAGLAAALASGYRRRAAGRPDGLAGRRRPRDLVSVVIPLYNQGRHLRQAVASARDSGHPEVEIVVVDDGSTDPATVEVFDALDGVTKVRQHNAGLPAARNAGIGASTGRYVVPLDADDLLPPAFIGKALPALARNPDLAYVAGYTRNFGLLDFVYVPIGYVPDLNLVLNTHARATALFRRDALDAIGGYDEALPAYEDWDLHMRFHEAGHESDILPMEGLLYRRHAESMTFTEANDLRLELLQHLLRKHAGALPPERAGYLLLVLAQLWKTRYEPSASVRFQRETRATEPNGSRPETAGKRLQPISGRPQEHRRVHP
jgi:glycosyltransferase involved in cell wall biosynthesis